MVLASFTVACTSDDDEAVYNNAQNEAFETLLANVQQYGKKSTTASARFTGNDKRYPDRWNDNDPKGPNMNDDDYDWKDCDEDDFEEGWDNQYMGTEENSLERAYFFIRLDGEAITDHGVVSSKYYYPQGKDGSSHYGEMNKGVIETDLSNTAIRPAEWNYYNRGVTKYIYSSNGSATDEIIVEAPDITRWAINGEPIDTAKYHVIWYIVKLQSDGWHVDGILTTKDVTELPDEEKDDELEDTTVDPTPTPTPDPTPGGDDDDEGDDDNKIGEGEVEFDIHQQEHQNWNEIKTTVHLRDTVNVRIFLPVDGQYIAVADDFDIRVGDEWGYITKDETVEEILERIKVDFKVGDEHFDTYIYVTHKTDGIEILIEGSTCAEALKLAREIYDDGITFEIHSYIYSSVSPATVWGWLQNTECAQTSFTGWPKSGDCCTYTYGQTTSAYYVDDDIDYSKRPEQQFRRETDASSYRTAVL